MNTLAVVVDTNIFVAALKSGGGTNRQIIRLCLQGRIQPLMGNALFAEYESLLNRQELFVDCPLDAAQREDLFNALMSVSRWVKVYYLWRPNLFDEGDNHVVDLAIAGGAKWIITNNVKDFRGEQMTGFSNVKIVTPQSALGELEK